MFSQVRDQYNPNKQALIDLSSRLSSEYKTKHDQAIETALRSGFPLVIEPEEGIFMELQYFKENRPFFFITHNIHAAQTISTNKLHPGGVSGFGLTGFGQTIGLWDGGKVRLTHQEFQGRAEQVDEVSGNLTHSTHVAATLIGEGFHPQSKGMAYQAHLKAWEWNNDVAEMAEAAANGITLSNHSYGFVTGWRYNTGDGVWYWFGNSLVSEDEDFLFGFYSSTAKEWDEIAYLAPYYLIVKSAGNDRGYGPPYQPIQHYVYSDTSWVVSDQIRQRDGGTLGFDCISHSGVSKNVLTVGAVHSINNGYSQPSDVVMTSFSSWGPTDDGRIKPDVVAKGVGTLSASAPSNTSYTSLDGTSMATPSVTGSIALINQHFQSFYPDSMLRASTLKALVIHSADPATEHKGPDYRFGWGLMNTYNAARIVSDDVHFGGSFNIRECTLTQDSIFEFQVEAPGNMPLVVTIAWNDPPATPLPDQINPQQLMLINDLDLRVSKDDITYLPFVLNPASPMDNPTTGDNFRDNVEKVFIENPQPGLYTIRVSHKAQLQSGSQDFSIILTGAFPEGMNVCTLPYLQLWEAPSLSETGWSTSNIQGQNNWLTTLDQNVSGMGFSSPTAFNGFASFSLDVKDPIHETTLISPVISIADATKPFLSFKHQAFAFPPQSKIIQENCFFIEASTDSFTNHIISLYSKPFNSGDDIIDIREWVSLDSCIGNSFIQIRFRFVGQGKVSWKIDDLFIYDQQGYDVFPLFVSQPQGQQVNNQTVKPTVYLINRGDSISSANYSFTINPGNYYCQLAFDSLPARGETMAHFDSWTPVQSGIVQGSLSGSNNQEVQYQKPIQGSTGNFTKVYAFEKYPRNTISSFLLEEPASYCVPPGFENMEVMGVAGGDTAIFIAVLNPQTSKTLFYSFDIINFNLKLLGESPDYLLIYGMDWYDGDLFVLSHNKILRVDFNPFSLTTIQNLQYSYDFKGLAFSPSGVGYTIKSSEKRLCSFQRITSPPQADSILNAEVSNYLDLAFNRFSGQLYLIAEDSTNKTDLYQVNISDATCSRLYNLDEYEIKSFAFLSPPPGTQQIEFTVDISQMESFTGFQNIVLTGDYYPWEKPSQVPFWVEMAPADEDSLVYTATLELPYNNFFYKYILEPSDTVPEWNSGPLRVLSNCNNWLANDYVKEVIKSSSLSSYSHVSGSANAISASMSADVTPCLGALSFHPLNQPEQVYYQWTSNIENGCAFFEPVLPDTLSPGYYQFMFSAFLDSITVDSFTLEYFVAPQPLVIPEQTIPSGIQLKPVSEYTISVEGGMRPFIFSVINGSLPLGVEMDSMGTISGIPQLPGTYQFDVKIVDALGSSKSKTLIMHIAPLILQLSTCVEGMGTIDPQPGTYEYNFGSNVWLSAQPEKYWDFDKWVIGELTLYQPELWWQMQDTVIAKAVFKPTSATFNVQVNINGSGVTVPSPGTHSLVMGQLHQFSAWPSEEWVFEKWIVNNNEEILSENFEWFLSEDMLVEAVFRSTVNVNDPGFDSFNCEVLPNPVQAGSVIHINSPADKKTLVYLHDIQGQLMWQSEVEVSNGTATIPFPMENVGQGTYILKLSNGTGFKVLKVIVK